MATDAREPLGSWEFGADRTAVRCELHAVGRDLLLLLTGGAAHVGAVAVAVPAAGGEPDVTVTTVPGHRETELARKGATAVARATGRTCVAVAGIHREAATGEEIAGMVAAARRGIAAAVARLATSGGGDPSPAGDAQR